MQRGLQRVETFPAVCAPVEGSKEAPAARETGDMERH